EGHKAAVAEECQDALLEDKNAATSEKDEGSGREELPEQDEAEEEPQQDGEPGPEPELADPSTPATDEPTETPSEPTDTPQDTRPQDPDSQDAPEQPTPKRKKRKSRRTKKREQAAATATPAAPETPPAYTGPIPVGLPRAFRGIKVETATYRMLWAFWHILMQHAPTAVQDPQGHGLTLYFSAQELYAFAVAHDYGTALVSWQKTERTLLGFIEKQQFPEGFTLAIASVLETTFATTPETHIFCAKLASVAIINTLFDPPFTL
ncbi:hypothetical protein JCM10908_007130, partial [Rhodotorula pacifica]|uniref:uncharacterized protein n=1 Tax=Rhodotorula pacifica TaxID=1495444 RepID=UPI00316FDA8B